jgi:hypothetical protein
MTAIRLTLGLSQRPAMTMAWHLRTVIIPRRTITDELDIPGLNLSPAFDFGLISILRISLEIFFGELSRE